MIPRIKEITPLKNYKLKVKFLDGKTVIYDVNDDIKTINSYKLLQTLPGLFESFSIDQSRTVVSWNDDIDLPSDTIYEYGIPV